MQYIYLMLSVISKNFRSLQWLLAYFCSTNRNKYDTSKLTKTQQHQLNYLTRNNWLCKIRQDKIKSNTSINYNQNIKPTALEYKTISYHSRYTIVRKRSNSTSPQCHPRIRLITDVWILQSHLLFPSHKSPATHTRKQKEQVGRWKN